MVNFILGPREHHLVKTPQEYLEAQAVFIRRRQEAGARYEVHEVLLPLSARIDHNTWVVDCECGAGNAVDPEWPIACCFGCGAIHRGIVFPPNRSFIEELLLKRPDVTHRNWRPGESLDALKQENVTLGIL